MVCIVPVLQLRNRSRAVPPFWLSRDSIEIVNVSGELTAVTQRTALYDELARVCSVRLNGGRERITAKLPDADLRETLGLPRSLACLSIERIGLYRRKPFEYRLTDVRSDRYAVIAEWSPKGYHVSAG